MHLLQVYRDFIQCCQDVFTFYECVYNIYVCACIYEIINYYSRMFRYLSLAFRPTCQVHLPEKAIFSHPPHSTNDFLSLFTRSPLYDPFPVHLDHFFSFIYTYHISRLVHCCINTLIRFNLLACSILWRRDLS